MGGDLSMGGGYFNFSHTGAAFINGNHNVQVRVDTDNNGSNYFNINNGDNYSIFRVDESGNISNPNVNGSVTIDDSLVVTGAISDSNSDVVIDDGLEVDGHLSMGGDLSMGGGYFNFSHTGAAFINGNHNVQVRVDTDSNGSNYFKINNGDNNSIFQVDEFGHISNILGSVTIDDSLVVTGAISDDNSDVAINDNLDVSNTVILSGSLKTSGGQDVIE